MMIRTYETPRTVGAALARQVAAAVRKNPRLVLGLPAGRTPIPFYDALVRLAARGRVDLSRVTIFNLDEFLGLPPGHPGSFRAFLMRQLVGRLPHPPGRMCLIDGSTGAPERECARYERAIARAGGVDLQVLGLGVNGHIGFNEPGPSLRVATHRTRLTLASRRANRALFGGRLADVPREALTMGMGTILRARRIVLVATGREKATMVRRLTSGEVTPWVPASFLQLHPAVEVLLDRAAASRL